jgi:folylpolyglutamate synthase/dihydropteroate synthase
MTALHILREKGLKLSDEAILKGFENAKWPGSQSIHSRNRLLAFPLSFV